MDLLSQHYTIRDSRPPPPPPIMSPIFPRVNSSSGTSFPIIAVAVIGILATAFLLVSYYIFVIKCCLNWHQIDLLRRFSLSRRRNDQDPLMASSPEIQNRGLDESVIRSIPVFKFRKKGGSMDLGEKSFHECAVCLNEFQEDEKLRIIPNCCHVFHIDCIDIWLQNNANCPLCRASVSSEARLPTDRLPVPRSSLEVLNPYPETIVRGDEEFVVIELGTDNNPNLTDQVLLAAQERLNAGDLTATARSISPLRRKFDDVMLNKKGAKFNKVTSMGDEYIDTRGKDEQFSVQPIRRSISMDSSVDRQLYLAVQEAINRQNQQTMIGEFGCMEGCGSSSRVKRSFFSFGSGRGSKSSVLPVYLQP